MWPKIGETDTYAYFYGLSMLVHLGLAVWLCRRRGIRLRVGVGLGLCYAWGMGIGAKLLYDILHHRLAWRNYLDIDHYLAAGCGAARLLIWRWPLPPSQSLPATDADCSMWPSWPCRCR